LAGSVDKCRLVASSGPTNSRDLGQAEVKNLCSTAGCNEEVRRLDVAVNDALRVGGAKTV